VPFDLDHPIWVEDGDFGVANHLRLAVEAVNAALADAGYVRPMWMAWSRSPWDGNAEIAVARELGIPKLRFVSRIPYGGGAACAAVQQAAMAIASGMAEVVVCYRALNERSGPVRARAGGRCVVRSGQWLALPGAAGHPGGGGHVRPALPARVRGHQRGFRCGGRSQARGHQPERLVLRQAHHACDHQASRWIAEPLRYWIAARRATARSPWW
jgi:hypothetical protein